MRIAALSLALTLAALSSTAWADDPSRGYHPYANEGRVRTLDMSAAGMAARKQVATPATDANRDWSILDEVESPDSHLQRTSEPLPLADPSHVAELPEGWVQRGNVVLPSAVADGELAVEPETVFQAELIPGNEYPRKHTLYLNFVGADLVVGADNSAINKSTLARQGPYPAYQGGNQKAVSIAQAVQEDVAAYGIRVTYLPEDRPDPIVPYTMEMMGGSWTDTNIEDPAGGVAPGADCGALGQRHVVYTFAGGGLGVNSAANTASQEAGHAWGLDHTFNCGSVMSYCGVANGVFSSSCDALCESQCQGPNSAGCRGTHEMFCGEGNDEQNEHEELNWLFGGPEPDVEDPWVNIESPEDGAVFESAADVDVRAEVGDDYGGYGWKFIITHNGEEVFNEVDFDREVDPEFRAALNLAQLEDGLWTVTVEVQDQFEHRATQTVSFQVGDEIPDLPEETGTDSGGEETGDETGVEGMADGGPGVDDGGCSCTAGSESGSGRGTIPAAMALILLLGAVRRRD